MSSRFPLNSGIQIVLPTNSLFILGSSSEFRRKTLDAHGVSCVQISPDIDEKAIRDSDPYKLPKLIAEAKREELIKKIKENEEQYKEYSNIFILTSDQIVLYNNTIREKPENKEEAIEYLSSYSSSSVSTLSALCLTHYPSLISTTNLDQATIYWNEINNNIINDVVSRGEIFKCAGGFMIEDYQLEPCINRIDGDPDSVLGLPMKLLNQMIEDIKEKI